MPPQNGKSSAASQQKKDKKRKRDKSSSSSSSDSSSSSSDSSSSSSSDDDDEEPVTSKKKATPAPRELHKDEVRLFASTSDRHDTMMLHYVNDLADLPAALAHLKRESVLSVDCEGVALSRTGQLCLVQVGTPADENHVFHVYLFDVVALGAKCFTSGLGELLQAPTPIKLFFDVRRDSEALYHQFGILLAGLCDIQLMEIARRRLRNENNNYLPGLGRLLSERFWDLDGELQRIKDGMSGKYDAEPDLWRKRPLTREQNLYAAIDVALLHILLDELTHPSKEMPRRKPRASVTPATDDAASSSPPAAAAASAASDAQVAASSTDAVVPPRERPAHVIPRASIFVDPRTRGMVEQYSDVVWAASIRDTDDEPDVWNRRHVPLVFQHATFPLSLQSACASVIEAKRAALETAKGSESKSGKKNKGSKRKAEAGVIDPKFNEKLLAATAAASPSSPSSSSNVTAASAAKQHKVKPISKLSGVAGTLKQLRTQQESSASASSASKGRPLTFIPAPSSSSSSKPPLTTASVVASVGVNAHIGNPDAFHPQVTKELLAQHQKQATKQSINQAKKQKIASAMF